MGRKRKSGRSSEKPRRTKGKGGQTVTRVGRIVRQDKLRRQRKREKTRSAMLRVMPRPRKKRRRKRTKTRRGSALRVMRRGSDIKKQNGKRKRSEGARTANKRTTRGRMERQRK